VVAALGIALVHGLSPAHWLPYVAAARANGWTATRLGVMTLGGTLLHLVATFTLTLLALLLSYGTGHLAGDAVTRAGGALLILLALAYLLAPDALARWSGRAGWLLLVAVGVQPCVEVIPLLLVAAVAGSTALVLAAGTFAATTLLLVPGFALAGFWGFQRTLTARTDRLARQLAGLILLLAGLLSLYHSH